MSIPSSPELLRARVREIDAQIGRLKAEIQQRGAPSPAVGPLRERLDELMSERVRLGFFMTEEPSLLELPIKKTTGKCSCIAALLVVGTLLAAGFFWVLRSEESASEQPPAPVLVSAQLPPPPKIEARQQPPVIERRVSVVWTAKVKGSSLQGVVAGADCSVAVDFGYVKPGEITSDPVITCGSRELYRYRPARNGEQRRTWSMRESFTDERLAYTYWLKHTDHGDRDDPPQLTIDTQAGTAVIWRDRAPAFRVELAVDPPLPRQGQPLIPTNQPEDPGFAQVVRRSGKVSRTTGAAAVIVATPCTVTVSPYWTSGRSCRVLVDCGGQILYGAGTSGYNSCVVADGVPTTASDTSATDGDDMLELDLPGSRVVVKNDQPGQQASVEIALSPPAAPPGL